MSKPVDTIEEQYLEAEKKKILCLHIQRNQTGVGILFYCGNRLIDQLSNIKYFSDPCTIQDWAICPLKKKMEEQHNGGKKSVV